MVEIHLEYLNEVHLKVCADPGIKQEMSDYFTFFVPGYKFMPKYKSGVWDGKIRLLNVMSGNIYYGLIGKIKKFCSNRGYKLTVDKRLIEKNDFPDDIAHQLKIKYNAPFDVRDYQTEAIAYGLRYNRALFLSPTASGKSYLIYLMSRFYAERGKKILIVVPTISLLTQMKGDFVEYNNNEDLDIHCISSGVDKNVCATYTITTWQSIQNQKKKWFEKFDVFFGDEAHLFKANTLTKILEKCVNVKYRFGFTGTLDESQTHKLVLTGLFGGVVQVTETKTLIANKTLADFKIKAISLKYPKEDCKTVKKLDYQGEIDWLISNDNRNKFISNLANSLSGNTLVLFQYVDKHGKVLLPLIEEGDKNVHFVHGGVKANERERIRKLVESTDNNVILASYGTFSTGINIKRLNNVIFASPSKSKIRNLQSIGRVLRRGNGKDSAILYDIVDDLQLGKKKNFAVRHFIERAKIYSNEGFNLKIYNVNIRGDT